MTNKIKYPPECKTEAEKTAFAFGWFKALEAVREQPRSEAALAPAQPDHIEDVLAMVEQADKFCDANCVWSDHHPDCVRAEKPAPAQEPVATDWERIARVQNAKLMAMCNEPGGFEKLREVMDRYERTTPPAPAQPWAGLTDEERHSCTQSPFVADNYRAIETKLKEKNTKGGAA